MSESLSSVVGDSEFKRLSDSVGEQELAVIRELLGSLFLEVEPKLPLIPVYGGDGKTRDITPRPMLPVAIVERLDIENGSPIPSTEEIIAAVASNSRLLPDQLLSDYRGHDVAQARQMAMYLIREVNGATYPEIGRLFSRDHSTVMYSVAKIKEAIKLPGQVELKADIKYLVSKLCGSEEATVIDDFVAKNRKWVEDVVVLSGNGLFRCPIRQSSSASKLLPAKSSVVLNWPARTEDDELWRQYSNPAYKMLLSLRQN